MFLKNIYKSFVYCVIFVLNMFILTKYVYSFFCFKSLYKYIYFKIESVSIVKWLDCQGCINLSHGYDDNDFLSVSTQPLCLVSSEVSLPDIKGFVYFLCNSAKMLIFRISGFFDNSSTLHLNLNGSRTQSFSHLF